MAVNAICEWQRLMKVAIDVARYATDLGVLSQQRVLCFGMIKREVRQDFLPARGRVALFTTLFECAVMRVNVARHAAIKFHVPITRFAARMVGLVTLFARNLNVGACERVSCF